MPWILAIKWTIISKVMTSFCLKFPKERKRSKSNFYVQGAHILKRLFQFIAVRNKNNMTDRCRHITLDSRAYCKAISIWLWDLYIMSSQQAHSLKHWLIYYVLSSRTGSGRGIGLLHVWSNDQSPVTLFDKLSMVWSWQGTIIRCLINSVQTITVYLPNSGSL